MSTTSHAYTVAVVEHCNNYEYIISGNTKVITPTLEDAKKWSVEHAKKVYAFDIVAWKEAEFGRVWATENYTTVYNTRNTTIDYIITELDVWTAD